MSSHREAPLISKDPVADNTDVYAFRTANDTVTLLACYLPAQAPAGGPNFYEFGDEVLYEIHVDNDGDGEPNISYQFRFKTTNTNPNTFLYNTGPISSLTDPNWNRRQSFALSKVVRGPGNSKKTSTLASNLPCPPANIGPRSTPSYESLAAAAVHTVGDRKVFAGQRADAFFVDLGSVFDLGTLRPFQDLHLVPVSGLSNDGVDALASANVQTLALQVPISEVVAGGGLPTDVLAPNATIGVWAAASRQRALTIKSGRRQAVGPWEQVSRLGNPLVNEVMIPLAAKDQWNSDKPSGDSSYAKYVAQPELAALLPVLYPGVFPNLAGLSGDRADLLAILLTGIPDGIISGFQNFTGPTQADMLRLNVAVPPATGTPNRLGILGGDLAGFPNGRRLEDDVTTIELRAVAGATVPLVNSSYVPDSAAALIEDGTFGNPGRALLSSFPYMGTPYSGYSVGT